MTSVAMPIDCPSAPPSRAADGPVVPNAHLAMGAVIVAELMLFAGLIGAYLVFRLQHAEWPPAGLPKLPLAVTSTNTLALVASAGWMHRGVALLRRGIADRAGQAMTIAAALGVTFLILQGVEWAGLVRHGFTLGGSVHGGVFYLLIGCHALHVAGAVLFLSAVAVAVRQSWLSPHRPVVAEICAAYWYFVTGLWLVLFGLVYLY